MQVVTVTNEDTVKEYFEVMKVEINPSSNYVKINHNTLKHLSNFHKGKPYKDMKRNDIVAYLSKFRKSDKEDPLHKWVGTYNLHLANLVRFFKWLHYPLRNADNRPKPKMIDIPKLRRKETSIYKPSDLWTLEDDMTFLKWCPSKRDRCYHAISRDLSARPHEILDLKIKDIVIKTAGNKQYAEVLVNGKTGTRHLPLTDSLPYIKEWLDQHPRRSNKNSYLICSMNRANIGSQISRNSMLHVYTTYHDNYFPKLLEDTTIELAERQQIEDLLKKPWNLYIRRHSSLTQKSKFLKEHILRQHAGWSPRSNMHLKYVHYFGNESSESILQEYGIIPKNEEIDLLRPKQCPNCAEYNRPDQKFCTKCKLVLTIEAFQESLNEQQEKDKQIAELMEFKQEMKVLLSEPQKFIEMLEEGMRLGSNQKKK